jgi:hypothetical protein
MDTSFFIENMVELLWQDQGIGGVQKLHDHIHDAFHIKDQKKSRGPRKQDPMIAARQATLLALLQRHANRPVHITEMDRAVGYTKGAQRSFDLRTLLKKGLIVKVKKGLYQLA